MSIELTYDQKEWIVSQFKQSFFGSRIKESSTDINFRCPFCGDSKKSLAKARGHLYKRTGTYHCFNCGKTTTGFGLLAQIKGISVQEVKKQYYLDTKNDQEYIGQNSIEKRSKEIQKSIEKSETFAINQTTSEDKKYIEPLKSWTDLTPICLKYLNARHIFDAPGFDKNSTLYYDTYSDRIIFPWRENNKIIYYQARAIRKNQTPKYMFPKGLKKCIYGLDNLDSDLDFICYTEGLLDAIFIKNCIAVGGLRPTIDQEKKLKDEYFNKELIWFSDNYWIDNASQEAVNKVCLTNPRQKIFKWPKECPYKDINEWVCAIQNYNRFWSESLIKKNTITVAQAKALITFNK